MSNELHTTKRELQTIRQVPPHIGALTAFQIMDTLAERRSTQTIAGAWTGVKPPPDPISLMWALVITAPEHHRSVRELLIKLIERGLGRDKVRVLNPPNPAVALDAPRFPEPSEAGITLHGENVLNPRLLSLGSCFTVRTTKSTVDGLADYFKQPSDWTVVWIEIGKGSPWRDDRGCPQ
jgi:hypothetical protein